MKADDVYAILNKKIKNVQASGGGITEYRDLSGKPQINGVTIQGELSLEDLGINNFSGNYEDLENKPDIPIIPESLPNPFPVNFKGYLSGSYDGSEKKDIYFPDAEITAESAGTPVGDIMAYMGTTPPENYLTCDGAVYNIADYPYLSQHFADNFASANFFGGDGETTFAVPDLRGELTNTSVLYCIKYRPTYFAQIRKMDNYSFEEQRVGTWVDGKPLYEKTVDFGVVGGATAGYKSVAHGIADIDTIFVFFCNATNSNSSRLFPIAQTGGALYTTAVIADREKVTINNTTNVSTFSTFVTLRYTKTTD